MARIKRMRKPERVKLQRGFDALMTELGFSRTESEMYQWNRETTERGAGLSASLNADSVDPWLALRFEREYPEDHKFRGGSNETPLFGDILQALRDASQWSAVNPYSGKFNLHCVGVVSAADALSEMRSHINLAIG